MKQLLVLSGKGGTGKTTVAAALIRLARVHAFADCDVDAPNLHLLMSGAEIPACTTYYGLPKAMIDPTKCLSCGLCRKYCRFNAVEFKETKFHIRVSDCEGCGVCIRLCPTEAISLLPESAGELELFQQGKVFSTACLRMGQGTSGRLVTEVKKQLKRNMEKEDLVILDGSPGIGCPVIASLVGVDIVLMVAEPSVSGLSDMKRLVCSARQFQIPMLVCTNKYDMNLKRAAAIETFCYGENIPFLGGIPFDSKVIELVNRDMCIVDVPCNAGIAMEKIYRKICKYLKEELSNDENCGGK